MKQRTTVGLIALAIMLSAASTGWCKDERIAVVSLERVLKVHPETAPAEARLEEQRQEANAERKGMLAKHEELRAKLEAELMESENRALSEEGRRQKLTEVKRQHEAMQLFEQEIRETTARREREILDRGGRMRTRILAKIQRIISAYAEKEGIALILNAEAAGMGAGIGGPVIYHEADADVTDAIIDIIQGMTIE
ncbi:MAG: OmpH family outer membrane protein [Verrucomicrobia bacterium]|nr:OmpH family outer membrane protein [Verrucomicrobiota bacterium]